MEPKCFYRDKTEYCAITHMFVCPEICEFCRSINGRNSGFARLIESVEPMRPSSNLEKNKPIKSVYEIEICIETCKKCEHSTVEKIKASDITEAPFGLKIPGLKHVVAFMGNLLRKTGVYGLSCKKCGCSCRAKATAVSMRLISDGCPDVDVNGKSRWDRALENI